MKKTILTIVITMMASFAFSQDENKYIESMKEQIKLMKDSKTQKGFQEAANNFERISTAEPEKWHPLYYTAFCNIQMNFHTQESDKKDTLLDKAQAFIDKALELNSDESELFVLQGLLYQAGIQVNPAARGMTYSMKAGKALNKAIKLNPENPRADYLLGMNMLHTPKAFGGGPKAACELFTSALQKFKAFEPQNTLTPVWGKKSNQNLYEQHCGEKDSQESLEE